MFFLASFKAPASFTYIAPTTIGTGYFVNHVRLMFKRWSEFGRTRKKEHIRNVKTCANGSSIAKHAWSFDHRIDFDNSSVIDKGSFRIRKTLRLGTPLLLSMLTITPSRFQTSIVFFLRNSHLISTFSLCFCSYCCFFSPFLYMLYSSCIPFLSVEGCRATAESLYSFKTF